MDVVFARGTGEPAGVGSVGAAFVAALRSQLPGIDIATEAVDYAASQDQSSVSPGATDLAERVTSVAARCGTTRFVLGGYSQGASVIDLAVGVYSPLGPSRLPAALAPRVAAIVVFGDPLGLAHQTIESSSTAYSSVAKSFCAAGDPVCGAGLDVAAHTSYIVNGSTQQAATFARGRLR